VYIYIRVDPSSPDLQLLAPVHPEALEHYIYMYIYIYMQIHICMYIYIYIYIYIYSG